VAKKQVSAYLDEEIVAWLEANGAAAERSFSAELNWTLKRLYNAAHPLTETPAPVMTYEPGGGQPARVEVTPDFRPGSGARGGGS
jgi:hypothetical protein